jgi:hypothetical protein
MSQEGLARRRIELFYESALSCGVLALTVCSACAQKTSGCSTNAQCGVGYLCLQGHCTTPCNVSADCPNAADTCDSGVCVPPGPGAKGSRCQQASDCASGDCACTDALCTAGTWICAGAKCDRCTYASPNGDCSTNALTSGVKQPGVCEGASSCYADGCKLELGADCTSAENGACESGFCECVNAGCTSRVCGSMDCPCKVYDPGVRACTATNLNDGVNDPGDCASPDSCNGGDCAGPCTYPSTQQVSCSNGCGHATQSCGTNNMWQPPGPCTYDDGKECGSRFCSGPGASLIWNMQTCASGSCSASAPIGSACTGTNVCLVYGCRDSTGCTTAPGNNGTTCGTDSCDSSTAQLTTHACQNGACTANAPVACPKKDSCYKAACQDSTSCNPTGSPCKTVSPQYDNYCDCNPSSCSSSCSSNSVGCSLTANTGAPLQCGSTYTATCQATNVNGSGCPYGSITWSCQAMTGTAVCTGW